MNNRLEEFVRGHSKEFDLFEPDEALWENIEKKLDKGRNIKIGYYLSRAAAVAAIFVLSFMAQQYFADRKNKTFDIPEVKEAEMYYSGLIDARMKEVKPFLAEFPEIEQEMQSDLLELDSVYQGLKNDLKDNVANHEVIEAMIENYRMRINILEEMLHFLAKNNNDNINKNNTEYEL
ncbi:MAG: hypothetical protein JXB34_04040 [Bacteroidales bacterium]|nr:hypothetical protein [Bacteroidales bacterium]